MNVVLLGAPGAGKGTQAQRVKGALGIPHVATGDILRASLAAGTEVGLRARSYMGRGELVPDEVVVAIVAERIGRPDCRSGWILDGFPRTPAQAVALDRTIWERGLRPIDFVVYLRVSPEVVVVRLSGRRVCPAPECGAAYHVKFVPPRQAGICDRCGTKLVHRDDDRAETVRARLETYERLTAGLVARYREAGLLVEIDASGAPGEVGEGVLAALGWTGKPPEEAAEAPAADAVGEEIGPATAAGGAPAKPVVSGAEDAAGDRAKAATKAARKSPTRKAAKKPKNKVKKKAKKKAKKKTARKGGTRRR